jgi:hypothetical protein
MNFWANKIQSQFQQERIWTHIEFAYPASVDPFNSEFHWTDSRIHGVSLTVVAKSSTRTYWRPSKIAPQPSHCILRRPVKLKRKRFSNFEKSASQSVPTNKFPQDKMLIHKYVAPCYGEEAQNPTLSNFVVIELKEHTWLRKSLICGISGRCSATTKL